MAVAQEHYESYKSAAHTITDEDIFQNEVGGRKAIHLPQLVVDQQSEHLEHRHVGTEQQGSSTIGNNGCKDARPHDDWTTDRTSVDDPLSRPAPQGFFPARPRPQPKDSRPHERIRPDFF